MSDVKLSPAEVIHEYLEGCADFEAGFDEDKLMRALNEHGYSIIPTASVDGWRNEIEELTRRCADAKK